MSKYFERIKLLFYIFKESPYKQWPFLLIGIILSVAVDTWPSAVVGYNNWNPLLIAGWLILFDSFKRLNKQPINWISLLIENCIVYAIFLSLKK